MKKLLLLNTMKKLLLILLCVFCFEIIYSQELLSVNGAKVSYLDDREYQSFYDSSLVIHMFFDSKFNSKYGKYKLAEIWILNRSGKKIQINPRKIEVNYKRKNGKILNAKVFSFKEFMKKVQKKQKWRRKSKRVRLNQYIDAASKTTSYTKSNTNYDGSVNSSTSKRGDKSRIDANGDITHSYNKGHSNTNSYYEGSYSTESTTTTIDANARNQAVRNARNILSNFDDEQTDDLNSISNQYLKRSSLKNRTSIDGKVYIKYKRRVHQTKIVVPINGKKYIFYWKECKDNCKCVY